MQHKTFLSLKTWLIFFLIIVLINCCKTDKSNEQESTGFSNQLDFPDSIEHRQLKNIYYQFPSAKEMFNFIRQEESLDFKPHLVNPVSNYPQYVDTKSKMLNLGVYLSDLSYLTLYREINKASEYMETIHNLYRDLRIDVPFTDQFIRRVKNNLNNEDSLIYLSESYSDEFYRYMLSNNKEHVLATVSAGSYIEGLYIAVNFIDEYKENSPAIQKIADQKYTFENLYNNLNEYKSDPNVYFAMQYIKKILSAFNQMESKKEPVKTSRDKDNKLLIEGGDKLHMTENQFNELKKLINQFRNEIITNSIN